MSDDYKIAFVDIETAPNLGYTWGKYEQTVLKFLQERYLLSFAIKWAGSKSILVRGLPDYPGFKRNKTNDKALATDLHKILNEADLIVAHNGDRFDLRVANARFLVHGLVPPAPYKTVDTLKVARKNFFLNSNKLDDLAQLLGVGAKIETGGIDLWFKCMQGDPAAWKKMLAYNKHDVVILEAVYEKLRPWHSTHPNIGIKQQTTVCPACGCGAVNKRGYTYKVAYRTQRYQCLGCGHWSQGPSDKLKGVHLR